MKPYLVLVLFCLSISNIFGLLIEDSQFQASNPSSINTISLSVLSSVGTRTLIIENIDFLGFDIVDESILNTFFALDETFVLNSEIETDAIIGDFKVAPSPITHYETSYFCYRLSRDVNVKILIYNRRGRFFDSIEIDSGFSPGAQAGYQKVPIDTSQLSAGIYFAFLKIEDEIKRTKFEVQP